MITNELIDSLKKPQSGIYNVNVFYDAALHLLEVMDSEVLTLEQKLSVFAGVLTEYIRSKTTPEDKRVMRFILEKFEAITGVDVELEVRKLLER